jgi:hypothetical protein
MDMSSESDEPPSSPSAVAPSQSEEIRLDPDQQAAYDAAWHALTQSLTTDLDPPPPTVVSLDDPNRADRDADEEDAPPVALVTPMRGHHALFRALERLEGNDKREETLVTRAPLTNTLTSVVLQDSYTDSAAALAALQGAGSSFPRKVCQHPFRKNDIVWVCRTCQADETCVLCHNCFSQSNHEGHDVAFYHAQAGGCCDCGDPDGTYEQ